MVNSMIVSRFQGPPCPPVGGGNRKIPTNGVPLYPPEEIQNVLVREKSLRAWTEKCRNDLQNLAFDMDDLSELLQETLKDGRYIDSEWCVQASAQGPWAACDAYVLAREEWIDNANRYMKIEYYLKFSMSKTGTVILTVSCHT